MSDFLHEFDFPLNTRLNLCVGEFMTQLAAIKDSNGTGRNMILDPMLANNTQRGKGFGVEYPTARGEIMRPKMEILPSGYPLNLFFRLDLHLLYRFSPRDEEGDQVNIQQLGFAFADYVWNWLAPGGPEYSDNPNGMVPVYPGAWRWDEKQRPEDSVNRSVDRLGPEVTKMSGNLWVTTLSAPLRIENPLVPYPIPS